MALIEKKVGAEPVSHKIKLSGETWAQVSRYMEFAELDGDIDLFFEEAAKLVLKKDRDFIKWDKEAQDKSAPEKGE